MTPEKTFADFLNRVRTCGPVLRLGVAVSGGGDSMALLRLAQDWAVAEGVTVVAATVDHGLRKDAPAEARIVAATCARLATAHETLELKMPVTGNLQDAARRGRYDLLADWAQRNDLDAVALGHTSDDQAETFIMRLARGSGVDGLAPMQDDWTDRGTRWVRPILAVERASLREYLTSLGQDWVEDPSNDDPRFDRVRVRKALQDLAELGLDRTRLVDTAKRIGDAREVLSQCAYDAAQKITHVEGGDVQFNASGFQKLPAETRHRLLAHAITYVSSSMYRPRYAALCALERDVLAGDRRTLQGCLVSKQHDKLIIGREQNALQDVVATPGALWDGRWVIAPACDDGAKLDLSVKLLGDGIHECLDWRETGHARDTLMASPSVWHGRQLIAAPLANFSNGWTLKTAPSVEDFLKTILSH